MIRPNQLPPRGYGRDRHSSLESRRYSSHMAIRVAHTPSRRCGRGEHAVCNKWRHSLIVIAPTSCSPSNPSKFDGPHMEVIRIADSLPADGSSPTFETATWYANTGSMKSKAPATSDIFPTASLIIWSASVRPARETGPACADLIRRARFQRSVSCPGAIGMSAAPIHIEDVSPTPH